MKDLYDFNILLKRKNTDCTKWNALKRDGTGAAMISS